MSARLIQVIESYEKRGEGTAGDPVREVKRYYTPEGNLLAERDHWEEGQLARCDIPGCEALVMRDNNKCLAGHQQPGPVLLYQTAMSGPFAIAGMTEAVHPDRDTQIIVRVYRVPLKRPGGA